MCPTNNLFAQVCGVPVRAAAGGVDRGTRSAHHPAPLAHVPDPQRRYDAPCTTCSAVHVTSPADTAWMIHVITLQAERGFLLYTA